MPSPVHASTTRPQPSARFYRRSWGLLLGASILILAAGAGCGHDESKKGCHHGGGCGGRGGAAQAAADRFDFTRTRIGMVRTDTRNGRVWVVPMNGDGGWIERGTGPDLAGQPAIEGRFGTMPIPAPRGGAGRGAAEDGPVLVRTDHATGRSWMLEGEEGDSWTEIRDTDSPPDIPTAPAASTPAPEPAGTATPTPASAASSSAMLDEESDSTYPILTGDQLGTTPEEKQETLDTLHNALTKEGLPRKMRVWAVMQLGELGAIDPDLAIPELLRVLDDQDPVVVAEAVRQLSRTGRASTIPRILKLRNHPDAGVRAAVAETVIQVN